MGDSRPSPRMLAVIRSIDRITDFTGTVVAFLSVPLVAAVCYEVVSRYVFNAPTVWAYDTSYMLYGTLFMLGAAYTLYRGAHIRTDFFWESFSIRTRGTIDSISYIVFFFPGFALLMVVGLQEALTSWRIHELADLTPWRPPLWPFKSVVPITCLLLLLQGVSELLKSLHAARTGEEIERKLKVQV
ncbi:TRAP-type mannitol/chloroaromatic compound transport system permease small subunit [Bradyrhizobium sp. AZCC 1588]|uniref:TRAP transporter small permease subunit n=1 Tax=Bradyrhizobium sp. AZCC 1588 TaxID=3117018 RepID=UPI002FEFFFB0